MVGTVDDDGLPDVGRAWGIWLVGDARLRCLLPADAGRTLANLGGNGRIAICMTQVETLESIQLKGRGTVVGAADDDDFRRHSAYWDELLANLRRTDDATPEQVRNMTPDSFVAVEVDVECVFDATPGPCAGNPR